MIGKIIFTAAVIGLVVLWVRSRSRFQGTTGALPARLPKPIHERSRFPRFAAYTVIGVMILTSILFLYSEWSDRYQIVSVRVINADTGQSTLYQAYKGDIADRRFQALDGRIVSLAEVERMELGGTE